MATVTVSEKGQIVIPADIRQRLGIFPGCQLEFTLEGKTIRIDIKEPIPSTRPEDGYGMLVCKKPGERRLAEFTVAETIQKKGR